MPDPDVTDIFLDEHDEYMILSNKTFWDVMTPENAINEVSLQRNVILAAKRLQDLAQSYGKDKKCIMHINYVKKNSRSGR